MSELESTYVQDQPPSPSEKHVSKDTYELSFYPGFVSRVTVVQDSIEDALFVQDQPFVLPAGTTTPWTTSAFHLRGGPNQRHIRLEIHDPQQGIEYIEVKFKPKAGLVVGGGEGETVRVTNGPVLCPPACEPI